MLFRSKTGGEGNRASDNYSPTIAWLNLLAAGEEAERESDRPPEVIPRHLEPEDSDAQVAKLNAGAVENTLRVDVETLNRLMNLVGELVQTRNQILQAGHDHEAFTRMAQRLDTVTADLRETVMQVRMQPVGHLFQRFPRMVREVEQSCAKRVRLEFIGAETGLDKSLLESLKDPLAHSIRNAVDHGIESPMERVRRGKQPEGVIQLRAFHEGGHVVLEVADDGAGISLSKVVQRAIDRKLITPERAKNLSENETLELLFEPGFSTRDEVTLISGRGVGMDVVRSNVERSGGTVELLSEEGKGTTLRMRVPLTLAIIPALIARCGGQMLAIPQGALVEMLMVLNRDEENLVEYVGEARMFRLRERLIPLISLSELLGTESHAPLGFYVAILEVKGRTFGLMVDDLAEPQEIVVKPLSNILRGLDLYSGATALSDGSLALILDIAGLARRSGLNEMVEAAVTARSHEIHVASDPEKKSHSMLVFEDYLGERKVVAMESLERIENVSRSQVEFVGGKPLLQYRGGLLELDDPGELFARRSKGTTDVQRLVLICKREGEERVGVVVRQVLDIAHGETINEPPNFGHRLALVSERLATVLDGFGSASTGDSAPLKEVA